MKVKCVSMETVYEIGVDRLSGRKVAYGHVEVNIHTVEVRNKISNIWVSRISQMPKVGNV
jgi:hypothetical protein